MFSNFEPKSAKINNTDGIGTLENSTVEGFSGPGEADPDTTERGTNVNIGPTNLKFTNLSAQNSEATALMINGSNVVGTRELGSNAFNSTSFGTGSVTNVTVGTGLDISTGTTTPAISLDLTEITLGAGLDSTTTGLSLDLSELTDMSADVAGSVDELIILDNGAERRKVIEDIKLSQFNNDSGFISSFDITTQTCLT